MDAFNYAKTTCLFFVIVLSSLANLTLGARKLNGLYEPPPMSLTYHKGSLLDGDVHVSILWYGKFTPPQKSIIEDFLLSLDTKNLLASSAQPSVSHWWNLIQKYMTQAGKKETQILLSNQISDQNCTLGKILKRSDIPQLANKANSKPGGLTLVLTGKDVTVEGFCVSNCGFHDTQAKHKSTFIWVGNSDTQCLGQCAWPFHQPLYGPQTPPLVAPNGDVGIDGMIINIASLLAGSVTNPFGNGYYLGSAGDTLEVGSACTGVYGKGAYPGYAGNLLVDRTSGGSYNAVGVSGRKYLLPALFDPLSSQCSTLV